MTQFAFYRMSDGTRRKTSGPVRLLPKDIDERTLVHVTAHEPSDVLRAVEIVTGVSVDEFTDRYKGVGKAKAERRLGLCVARAVAVFALYENTTLSHQEIGDIMGAGTHSTAIYWQRCFDGLERMGHVLHDRVRAVLEAK